jgi:nitroimidazol reductase NimA-like FMN-containing flavoprotein (pyridoxamine 5'-phosphate oxidase superfamily)
MGVAKMMNNSAVNTTQRRPVRLQDREIDEAASRAILDVADHGVLATASLSGEPYAVPLSFVLVENALYVHGSGIGHRNEAIGKNPNVCFTVVGRTTVHPEIFDRDYESVIVFGKARAVVGEEKRMAMEAYLSKYCPGQAEAGMKKLGQQIDRIFVVRIAIEHMTGKAHQAVAEDPSC